MVKIKKGFFFSLVFFAGDAARHTRVNDDINKLALLCSPFLNMAGERAIHSIELMRNEVTKV